MDMVDRLAQDSCEFADVSLPRRLVGEHEPVILAPLNNQVDLEALTVLESHVCSRNEMVQRDHDDS